MKKSFIKRGASALLAIVMCLTTLIGFGTTAYAAGEQAESYIVAYPRDGDSNYSGNWGHSEKFYMNGWFANNSSKNNLYAINSYSGQIAYCIEPGTPLATGDTFTAKDESFWDNYPSTYNHTISPYLIKMFIGRILQYGYTGTISTSWRSQNAEDADKLSHAIATQMAIWETIVGERDSNFELVSTGGKDRVSSIVALDHPLYSQIMGHYNTIVSGVQSHTKLPSFMAKTPSGAKTFELEWNGTNYTITLTDTNNVLSNYNFSSSQADITFSKNGNKLTVTSPTAPTADIKVTAEKTAQRKGVIVWDDGTYEPGVGRQNLVTYAQTVNDPVSGYFNLKVSYGSAKIVKTSEDGIIGGISFRVTGNGFNETVKTNDNGEIQIDNLMPGVYTVTELENDRYEPQEVRRVTVVAGQTATVTFNNTLKRGTLEITKSSEDGLNEGVTFHLYGVSLSGAAVDEYAVTDENGIATFEDVLISGETPYTIEEVDTAIRYVVPEKQVATIKWNEVTSQTVTNVLKKFTVSVTKSDKETGDAQGDATLAGAKYGIYKDGVLVDEYITDENGQFVTKEYVCGDDWTIKEISPSEGYLLDNSTYKVGAKAENYTIEHNQTSVDVTEQVSKGYIAIIKHCDDGTTKIETPEEGAIFAVYLKSAGSYENAEETERAILVCDENGYAKTKELPYGVYVVEQREGWEGKEKMPPFDVNVNKDGETYRYLINNATFEAEIEIVKKDAETGKIIPASGIGFKVRNTDTGEYVIQRINYPTPVDIEVYYTDNTGKLMLPSPLPYGNYEIIEQNTCYGYVLDSDPVAFKVDGTTDIVTVVKSNIAQKGTITVEKTGEVFASVREINGVYQPVYEIQGLPGAVYEIAADEDIVTLDGTVRYTKGQIVATITTGADGKATTEPLYLGKYSVKEITAPQGMILNAETVHVELTYAGEDVKITTASTSFYNERQKVVIDLSKTLEKDDVFDIGNGDEITRVQFALYAVEDLTAADSTVIPKDALIEIATCDASGKITFTTDLPVGAKVYVKEYATDSHYILSDLTYEVTFDYEGQDTDTVNKNINDGNAIDNEIIRGSIVGQKLDEDGFAICGALFGLFAENETEFTEETAILTCESNEIGIFCFEDVPFGRWIVREIKAAPAFVLNENSYAVTVAEDEQVVEIVIENEFITGSVKTVKVDKEHPENTLGGAIFEIFVDVDGNKEFNAEIDLLIGEMTEGENGVYTMDNLRYNGYFLYEKASPEGFLKDDDYYYFEIRNEGETVVVENEAGVGFANQPIKGNVTTTKVDEEYPENKLTGAVFHIYADTDKDGEFNAENDTFVVTLNETEVGIYLAEGIRYGGYFLYEETAPVGFVKDETYHYFEIRNDGETITVENKAGIGFTNKPITGELELTKTDIADGKPLAGVGFRIKDEDGNTVIEGYTDENGIAKFTLRYGKYTYSEFDPLEGYVANTDEYPFEITEDGQIIKASITNEKIPVPDIPQTGDNSNLGFWIGLGAVALGGLIAMIVIGIKRKKDDEE